MATFLGREPELERITALLASSTKMRAARAVRIVAPSGFGKTALLEAALDRAPKTWLRAEVTCHHIQSSLPFFVARRVVRALLDALGTEAERYSSGLDLDREQSAVFEESFYRVLEGISLDHPLLFAFDDAQWTDGESRALIERSIRALADRPIVLLSTERTEDAGIAAFDFRDEAIALNELSDDSASDIIKGLYPAANDAVIDAIIERSGGRAVDLITLSEGAREQRATNARDVDLSLRRTIARDLALVDARLREFLQISSLIDDPIDYAILRGLWSEEHVTEFIASASGRFLTQQADGLHFVHDAIKQSVQETIAIAIPLHRRIIAAIQAQPSLRFEDYERIVEQAAACGDRELQRATLMRLGEAAFERAIYSLAARSWERALEIAPPPLQDIVPFYTRLSMIYNATSREPDNIRICNVALDAARSEGIVDGTAGILSSLIMAQWFAGNQAAARADLARAQGVTSLPDRAQILSTEAYIAMADDDLERADSLAAAFAGVEEHASPIVKIRMHTFRSFVASRNGDGEKAIGAARAAEDAAANLPPMMKLMPLVASLHHTFTHGGPTAIEPMLARRPDEQGLEILDFLRVVTRLSVGEFEDVRTLVSEALVRQRGVFARRIFLGFQTASLALASPSELESAWQDVAGDIAAFHTGDESSALVPIVTGWLVHESAANPKRARAMLVRVLQRLSRGLDPMIFPFPVLLSIAAKNIGDNELLERLASEDGFKTTRDPWAVAQRLLARGAAASFLGKANADDLLRNAKERLGSLGATYFAGLVDQYTRATPPQVASGGGRFGTTTRREREIAGLVAEGLTNREIAEKLVLSERTIEGHIANLFGKLDVSSRTQVAAWYLRATSSVA